jgi:hypothetical protein
MGLLRRQMGLHAASGSPLKLPITATRMGVLLDAVERAYRVLGLAAATGGDEVFAQLVLARIIEPASKLDSLRGAVPALTAAAIAAAITATSR